MAVSQVPGKTLISAIIIDDENHSIQTLRYELERHCPEVDILATGISGQEGLRDIARYQPDLVFLDIEMPSMNGFQMLQQVKEIDFEVIFVTAYDQYAIQAFRFAAIDYLLKPIIASDLIDSVQRVLHKKERNLTPDQLFNLLHNLKSGINHPPRIAVPLGNSIEFVAVDEIIHCQAESNYTHMFVRGGQKFLLTKTLREMEDWLSPYDFFRCHQSHLINIIEIKRYVKNDGPHVVMSNQSKIPVSRRRSDQFLEILKR